LIAEKYNLGGILFVKIFGQEIYFDGIIGFAVSFNRGWLGLLV
jgi:hypothetical protein